MKYAYPIVLTKVGNDYVVFVPGAEINTEGSSVAEAIEMAEDAIGLWGISKQDLGQSIPEPLQDMPELGENQVSAYAIVDFDAYRRANDMRTVRKNCTIPVYLNDRAIAENINFSKALQRGLKLELGIA